MKTENLEQLKNNLLNSNELVKTTDVVKGDYVMFTNSIYGDYNIKKRTAKYLGEETIIGYILNESYGDLKHQHTFTVLKLTGEKRRIKGRNLYKNCKRALWVDENLRQQIADEKHERCNKIKNNENNFNF